MRTNDIIIIQHSLTRLLYFMTLQQHAGIALYLLNLEVSDMMPLARPPPMFIEPPRLRVFWNIANPFTNILGLSLILIMMFVIVSRSLFTSPLLTISVTSRKASVLTSDWKRDTIPYTSLAISWKACMAFGLVMAVVRALHTRILLSARLLSLVILTFLLSIPATDNQNGLLLSTLLSVFLADLTFSLPYILARLMSSNVFQNMSFTAVRCGYLGGGGGGGGAMVCFLVAVRLTGGIAAAWPPASANCLLDEPDVTLRTLTTENASCNTKTSKWVA